MKGSIGRLCKFEKSVDKKMGKGFSMKVKAQVMTPIVGGKVLEAGVKEAFKTVRSMGKNAPMRTDRRTSYRDKCGIIANQFATVLNNAGIATEEETDKFKMTVLYPMIDGGLFIHLSLDGFLAQYGNLYRSFFKGIPEGYFETIWAHPDIRKRFEKIWRE